jgi:hypothetical protein
MTYIELVNAVLVRLRENQVDSRPSDPDNFLRDPYQYSIGAHVNDAKKQVEDSWQWSALRRADPLTTVVGQTLYTLPNSQDNSYILKRIQMDVEGNFLQMVPLHKFRRWSTGNVDNANPFYWAPESNDPTTGSRRIHLWPPPKEVTTATVESVYRQADLVTETDRLEVPSLPVYTLATALASRERGEVGGAPTSELFAAAQTALSDAIAIDSAQWVEEMDWFSETQNWHNTNVRTA